MFRQDRIKKIVNDIYNISLKVISSFLYPRAKILTNIIIKLIIFFTKLCTYIALNPYVFLNHILIGMFNQILKFFEVMDSYMNAFFSGARVLFKSFVVNYMPITIFLAIARILPIGDWLKYEKQDKKFGDTSFSKAIKDKNILLLDRILKICSKEALDNYLKLKDHKGVRPLKYAFAHSENDLTMVTKILSAIKPKTNRLWFLRNLTDDNKSGLAISHLTKGDNWFPRFSEVLNLLDYYIDKDAFICHVIINSVVPPTNIPCQDIKDAFLEKAIKNRKSVTYIRQLIEDGADVNTRSMYGEPLIVMAAHNGTTEIVDLLIEKKAKIDRKYRGYNALMMAVQQGHIEVVKKLIQAGAKLDSVDYKGNTPFILSVINEQFDVAGLLLQKNILLLEGKDQYGFTPLMMAVKLNQIAMVEWLFQKGADFNVLSNEGYTLLMIASFYGCIDVAKFLIKNGADLNAQCENGDTALILAAESGHINIVELLLKKGVNIESTGNKNKTAMMKAAARGHAKVVERLIKANANINATSASGKTALMYAAKNEDISEKKDFCDTVLSLLVKTKPNFQIVDEDGHTALSLSVNLIRYNHNVDNTYRLLDGMSSLQIEAAIKQQPFLNTVFQKYQAALLENQKKIFSLFGACLIKEDQKSFIMNQPIELIALQLSHHFPKWYANRLEKDMRNVFTIIYDIKEKREKEKRALNEEKAIFDKLYSANPKTKLDTIQELGEKYTYQNCLKHLGYVYSARAFPSDAIKSVTSYFFQSVRAKNNVNADSGSEQDIISKADIEIDYSGMPSPRIKYGILRPF